VNERKELRKARAAEKRTDDSVDTATRALLTSPDGRSFLWWLLDITRYGGTPWTTNALTTSFNCGEQNIGQQLLARLTSVDPEGFLNLLKERNDDRHDDDGNSRDRDDDGGNYDNHPGGL